MSLISFRALLDGSMQTIYTAPSNGIIGIKASVRSVDANPVTFSAWLKTSSNDQYLLTQNQIVDDDAVIKAFSRLAMATGDQLIVQASGAASITGTVVDEAATFSTFRAFLDGSSQAVYNASTATIGIKASVRSLDVNPVTISAWLKTSTGVLYPLLLNKTVDSDTAIKAFTNQAMATGDQLIIQASGAGTGKLASLVGSVAGEASRPKIEMAPYLILGINSSHASCGSCSIGGKILTISDFVAGTSYSLNVNLNGITLSAGNIQIHKWTQVPNTSLTGRVWVADVPITGGDFNFTVPNSNFYGLSIFAKNPNKSDYYDAVCCTWDRSTRTISLRSF